MGAPLLLIREVTVLPMMSAVAHGCILIYRCILVSSASLPFLTLYPDERRTVESTALAMRRVLLQKYRYIFGVTGAYALRHVNITLSGGSFMANSAFIFTLDFVLQ